jgi:hypothetical protein
MTRLSIQSLAAGVAPFAQVDETLVGGKGSPHEKLVLLAAEADGRCVSPTPRTTMKGR